MDKRELLKSMLNNFINDKPEESQLDLHNYLTLKMKEISGISSNDSQVEGDVDASADAEVNDNDIDKID